MVDNDSKQILDYLRSQKAEAETLVLSEPKTQAFNDAMDKFDIKKDGANWEDKPNEGELLDQPPPQPYEWLTSKEDSSENRKGYMEYLGDPNNIELPENTQLFEGDLDKNLLSVRFLRFDCLKVSGNIDVILASSHHQSIATVRQNILVGIELKKDTNRKDQQIERQVTLQHVAASYLNPDTGVLTVMTDLKDRWHFFWFAKPRRVLRYEATKSEARFLIKHSLDKKESNSDVSTPDFFLDRACWNDLYQSLDSIAEGTSFEERDGEDAALELQQNDRDNGGWTTHSTSINDSRTSSQQGVSGGGSQYTTTSQQRETSGGSKASRARRRRQRGPVDHDGGLHYEYYMDEEERREATLLRALQTSFHKMLYIPEDVEEGGQGIDALPSEIFF